MASLDQVSRVIAAGFACLLVGCSTDPEELGPLAVTTSGNGGNSAGLRGILRIGSDCVYVEGPSGTRTLIVWPEGKVRYNAATAAVEGWGQSFEDGSTIAASGGVLNGTGITWVKAPAPSCNAENMFSVDEVRLAQG